MATHSSVLAWRIPGTGKPGGLPSMVSHRVGHNKRLSSSSSSCRSSEITAKFWIAPFLQRASLLAQLVKNPPAMWETSVQSLGWEDSLEKGKVTHSSILAWRIPWSVCGIAESDRIQRLSLSYKNMTELSIHMKESDLYKHEENVFINKWPLTTSSFFLLLCIIKSTEFFKGSLYVI